MKKYLLLILAPCFFTNCSAQDNSTENQVTTAEVITEEENSEGIETSESRHVIAQNVAIDGEEKNYTFSVTLSSPDTGCDQYADWWEVITENGTLIYRRILGHSHVDEQPFIRSGSSINVEASQIIIIRGHMNNLGYGTSALKGSIATGFETIELDASFAASLSTTEPLPTGCTH